MDIIDKFVEKAEEIRILLGLPPSIEKDKPQPLDEIKLSDWLSSSESGFKVLTLADKEAQPSLQGFDWLGWYTNNFKDLEEEIISEYALRNYVDEVRAGEIPYPELWWYHITGTKHGVTSKLWQLGHFVIAAGKFDSEEENPLVKALKQWYAKQNPITMSHGFMYDPAMKMNGVYYHLETYEITTLRSGSEANPYTQFEVNKMATVTDEQQKLLEQELGSEVAALVVERAESYGEELRKRGAAFKSIPPQDDLPMTALYIIAKELGTLLAANKKAQGNKETDLENRITGLEVQVGDLGDKLKRMTEAFTALTRKRPAASKAASDVEEEDEEAALLEEENNRDSEKPKSVLAKMRGQ